MSIPARDLFSRKPVGALWSEWAGAEIPMRRVLGPFNLVTLGIGGIIGAGIFVITGQAAAQYAGPAVALSFVLSGVGCGFAALCYAEFASLIPVSGSAYTYAYATMGELIAWIIGWDLILEYLFSAATVTVGWSGYVLSLLNDFGITLPCRFSQSPVAYTVANGWHATGALLNIPAVVVVLVLTALLTLGIKASARANDVIVLIKICIILLFIGFGLFYVRPENWTQFIPLNTGTIGAFGVSGVVRGAGVVFCAHLGFDAVTTASQECRNPQKDMPIGILGSLGVCSVLYVLVALVLTGLVRYDLLLVPDPIAFGVNAAGHGLLWLRPLVKIGAIAGLSSVVFVTLFGQSRVFYAMAADGLLPAKLARLHHKYRTPHLATIIGGSFGAIMAATLPIGVLGELVSIGTLLAFAIVCFEVLVHRYANPALPRPFKAPGGPTIPVLGALVSLLQILFLPPATWIRLAVWMGVGLAIYFSFGIRHSALRNQRED